MTTVVTPPHWGERSYLYDKSLSYVFSLDVTYRLEGKAEGLSRVPLVAVPPKAPLVSTYRVVPSDHYDSVEKIKRDVPRGRISMGRDWLTLAGEGAVPLDGRLLIDTESPDPIVMIYTGVMSLPGGTLALAECRSEVRGTAFIASQQEVSIPRYKWLVYNQLVGIGRVAARESDGELHFAFSFDLYLGS